MTPPDWPAGVRRVMLDVTDSTNAETLRRAEAGETAPFWVIADRQTAGRGRRGRAWLGQTGNFYATLAMVPTGPQAGWALRSFVAALALHDALTALGVHEGLTLKWPNDVLLNGGKLAGILLEAGEIGPGRPLLRVGIGVNLAHAPALAELDADAVAPASLAGHAITPHALLDHLAPAFASWDARLTRDGFAPLRDAWTARAHALGQVVSARVGQDRIPGRLVGLDDTGALVLDTGAGRRHLAAADVFFHDAGGG